MSGDAPERRPNTSTHEADALIRRVGNLTRLLRDNMRELGLDKAVEQAAQAIPDARERLRYVIQMTEQAATQVLGATEIAQPMQVDMGEQAKELQDLLASTKWAGLDGVLRAKLDGFLSQTVARTDKTQEILTEIMMAQSFQDLTGQVLSKMVTLIGDIEKELILVLIENIPESRRDEASSLLNGPQVSPQGKTDVVTNQDQVDDLLSSLGF